MSTNSDRSQVKLNNKTTITFAVIIPIIIIIAAVITKFSYVENRTEINKTRIENNCERINKQEKRYEIQSEKIDNRFNRLDDKLDVIIKEIKN